MLIATKTGWMRWGLMLGAGLVFGAPVQAAVFKVGAGGALAGCTHARLADAIAAAVSNGAGLDEIRVNTAHTETPEGSFYVIDQSITLRGGFASCRASGSTGRTTLRSSGQGSVFVVVGGAYQERRMRIENFELVGDRRTVASGGGMGVYGFVGVDIHNVRMRNLSAQRGGALYVDSGGRPSGPHVALNGVTFEDNHAAQQGGGVYCVSGTRLATDIQLDDRSVIQRNRADGAGGGVANHGCWWHQFGGKVLANQAPEGGGLYTDSGGHTGIARGGWAQPAEILDNIATRSGAGLLVSGAQSRVTVQGSRVDGNAVRGTDTAVGAAVHARAQGEARIEPDLLDISTGVVHRSTLNTNHATLSSSYASSGSVVAATGGGRVLISGTELRGNAVLRGNASLGAVVQASPATTESSVQVSNSVLAGNRATRLFEGTLFQDDIGGPQRGKVDVRLVSLLDNRVSAVVDKLWLGGSGPTLFFAQPLVHMAATSVHEYAPLLGATAPSPDSVFDCVVSTQPLPATARRSVHVQFGVDPTTFRPLAGFPGADFCSADDLPAGMRDFAGTPRPYDLPSAPNVHGAIDAGAFEAL